MRSSTTLRVPTRRSSTKSNSAWRQHSCCYSMHPRGYGLKQSPRGERSGCIDSSGCGAVVEGSGGAEEAALVSTTTGSAAVNGVASFHFFCRSSFPIRIPFCPQGVAMNAKLPSICNIYCWVVRMIRKENLDFILILTTQHMKNSSEMQKNTFFISI